MASSFTPSAIAYAEHGPALWDTLGVLKCANEAVMCKRVMHTLYGDRSHAFDVKRITPGGGSRFAAENLPRVGDALETRSNMGRVTARRVIHPKVVADGSDYYLAAVESHAHLDI